MGRNRRTHTDHAIRVIREGSTINSYVWGQTWCGDSNGMSAAVSRAAEGEDLLAYSRRSTNCPKCAAALGKARLAQISDRVRVEAAPPEQNADKYGGKKYRGLYKVYIDGEHRAWIVMQNGWGNPWELHQLNERPDDDWRIYGACVSSTPSNSYSTVKPTEIFQMAHAHSRDLMASAALKLHEKGEMPTVAEMQERTAARRARQQQEETERQEQRRLAAIERDRKDAMRAERKQLALDGLKTIQLRDLTNLEVAGLVAALEIIQGKDVQ